MHAVGADEHIAVDAAAVGEDSFHTGVVLADALDSTIEQHAVGRAVRQCLHQDLVQVTAMNVQVKLAVAVHGDRGQRHRDQ